MHLFDHLNKFKMPPPPLRGQGRKASSSLPHVQRANFLLDASKHFSGSSEPLASHLGRCALQTAAGDRSSLPRGAITSMCSGCGIPYTSDTYNGSQVVRLSHLAKRRRRRKKSSSITTKDTLASSTAAIVYKCTLCNAETRRLFDTVESATEVLNVKRSG